MAVQGLNVGNILAAYGQLQQANARRRQQVDRVNAERRASITSTGRIAGGLVGGIVSGGSPVGVAAGSMLGGGIAAGRYGGSAPTAGQTGQDIGGLVSGLQQQQQAEDATPFKTETTNVSVPPPKGSPEGTPSTFKQKTEVRSRSGKLLRTSLSPISTGKTPTPAVNMKALEDEANGLNLGTHNAAFTQEEIEQQDNVVSGIPILEDQILERQQSIIDDESTIGDFLDDDPNNPPDKKLLDARQQVRDSLAANKKGLETDIAKFAQLKEEKSSISGVKTAYKDFRDNRQEDIDKILATGNPKKINKMNARLRSENKDLNTNIALARLEKNSAETPEIEQSIQDLINSPQLMFGLGDDKVSSLIKEIKRPPGKGWSVPKKVLFTAKPGDKPVLKFASFNPNQGKVRIGKKMVDPSQISPAETKSTKEFFDAEGNVLLRETLGGAALTPPIKTSLQKKILENTETLASLDTLKQKYEKRFLQVPHRILATGLEIAELGGVELDPENQKIIGDLADFQSETVDLTAKYVKNISGAAVSDNEVKRLAKVLPNKNDSPTVFKRKMDSVHKRLTKINLIYKTILAGNKANPSSAIADNSIPNVVEAHLNAGAISDDFIDDMGEYLMKQKGMTETQAGQFMQENGVF